MNKQIKEISDKLFKNVFGYEEIKETIILGLVSDSKILLISDRGIGTSNLFNSVKNNFSNILCIEDLQNYLESNSFPEGPILAGSYPQDGKFDVTKPIVEQIKIPAVILNKFDVLFILRDFPEKKRDQAVAESLFLKESSEDLSELKKQIEQKRKIVVEWQDHAKQRLVDFYVKIRNQRTYDGKPVIPISSKQLATLKRICESYTKISGRKEVSLEDAEQGITLMKFYMMQVGDDDEEQTTLDKISARKIKKMPILGELILDMETRLGKLLPIEELEKECEGKMTKEEFERSIDKLIEMGNLEKPKKGFVQRILK